MYNNENLVNTLSKSKKRSPNRTDDTLKGMSYMERKKKKQSGGMYLAICCCVVIVAIVGYANRMSLKEDVPEEKIAEQVEKTPEPVVKETSQKTIVEEKEEEKPAEKASAEPQKEEKEEIKFNPPVDGKVIEEYSGDDLVYNEALKDWRAHSGVDFEAELGENVIVSAKGVVEDVFDSNMGRCVVVDHQNGFKTMYANLDEDTEVKEGDILNAGDIIGKVGNTALGDATDMPHLHFEMMKEEACVNPVEYFE